MVAAIRTLKLTLHASYKQEATSLRQGGKPTFALLPQPSASALPLQHAYMPSMSRSFTRALEAGLGAVGGYGPVALEGAPPIHGACLASSLSEILRGTCTSSMLMAARCTSSTILVPPRPSLPWPAIPFAGTRVCW